MMMLGGNSAMDEKVFALASGPRTTKTDVSAIVARPLLIVGLILCYYITNFNNIVNSFFLQSTLEDMKSDFNSELEASCAADPGGSPLCIEAQLFRGWFDMPEDAPGSLEKLLEITPQKSSDEQSIAKVSTSSIPGVIARAPSSQDAQNIENDSKPSMRGSTSSTTSGKELHAASFTHDLVELQEKLEAKRQEQANRHAQHRALHVLSLAAQGVDGKTASRPDGMTSGAHELDTLTDDIQHHMAIRKKVREDARAAVQAAAPSSPTALYKQRKRHSFADEVQAAGWELCQDSHRHNLPACAQFLKRNSTEETRDLTSHHQSHEAAITHIHELEKNMDDLKESQDHETALIKEESEQLLNELCADPARRSYPACAKFLRPTDSLQTTDGAASPSLRGRRDSSAATTAKEAPRKHLRASAQVATLSWDSMRDWVTKHGREVSHDAADKAQYMFHRQDERLRGEWQGLAPTVACITVLPQGQVTEMLMKSFMDNYNSQEYEGDRKLVIVYHKEDTVAADIVRSYVDEKSVIAAAAFGEGHFISSTAYRYGGWLAKDSDITAQWDFDAWHHPLQLSMQVRAMVVSARPAAVVTWVTDFNTDGTKGAAVRGGSGQHGSMTGETSWMRKNWMPLIEEEHSVPSGMHAHEVVQVDMPELLAYHDMKAHEQFVGHR